MKIRILTDEDGNILAFATAGGVEWQEIDVKDEELDELSADLSRFKLKNGRLQKTDSYRISLMEKIRKELYELRLEYDVKPFEFEVDGVTYLQNNRSIDQSNLTRIVVMIQAMGVDEFSSWKFYTKDNSEKFVAISLQDMMKMASIMQSQTTRALITESTLIAKLKTLTVEELNAFDAYKEFENLWNK